MTAPAVKGLKSSDWGRYDAGQCHSVLGGLSSMPQPHSAFVKITRNLVQTRLSRAVWVWPHSRVFFLFLFFYCVCNRHVQGTHLFWKSCSFIEKNHTIYQSLVNCGTDVRCPLTLRDARCPIGTLYFFAFRWCDLGNAAFTENLYFCQVHFFKCISMFSQNIFSSAGSSQSKSICATVN